MGFPLPRRILMSERAGVNGIQEEGPRRTAHGARYTENKRHKDHGTRLMVHGKSKEKSWMPAWAGMTETCMAHGKAKGLP